MGHGWLPEALGISEPETAVKTGQGLEGKKRGDGEDGEVGGTERLFAFVSRAGIQARGAPGVPGRGYLGPWEEVLALSGLWGKAARNVLPFLVPHFQPSNPRASPSVPP